MANEILIPPAKGFNPFVDLTKYNFGAFAGNRLVPQMSEEDAAQAGQMGSAAAMATAAGQQAAEDIAKKQEQEKQAEQEASKRNRFNMLVDYFRPKSTEQRMVEAEARNKAQDEREAKLREINDQMIAEGNARDLLAKQEQWQKETQPAPLYELGRDYFNRPIMTNKPAATAAERTRRIEAYNLAPGSLTQFAMGGLPAGAAPEAVAAGKEALASESANQMIQESQQRGQQIAQAAEGGWTYNRALGRYVKSKVPSRSALPTPQAGITLPSGQAFNFNIGKRNLR